MHSFPRAPRVIAAVFGTAWNRWVTARRFQNRGAQGNLCVLGCGAGTNDSIEHYSRCRVLRHCHSEHLGVTAEWLLPIWLGCADQLSDEQRAKGALGVYVSYRLTNLGRNTPGFSRQEARDGFRNLVAELAASGCASSTAPGARRRRESAGQLQGRKRPRRNAPNQR